MKESKILKAICYISIPILIAVIVLSSISISLKRGYYNEEEYFSSENFVNNYINITNSAIRDLIYHNNSFNSIKDKNIEIFYSTHSYGGRAKDQYFLIIYKNQALTNVELTSKTNTIEKIKAYINQNEQSKFVNIIKGEIQSESEIIQDLGIKYFNGTLIYYTIEPTIITEVSDEYQYETEDVYRNYITTKPEDFEIYSSFIEQFNENSGEMVVKEMLDKFPTFEKSVYLIIPISVILIILSIVYLIISIGYKKGIQGIALNDFDKIPLEIIIIISICLGCIPFMLLETMSYSIEDYKLMLSLLITGCFVIYILCATTLHTLIKRIKSKTLLKSTIIGRILKLILRIFKKIKNVLKREIETLTYSTNVTAKVTAYAIIMTSMAIFILLVFQDSFATIFFESILVILGFYKIIKSIKQYKQIENKLKEMYEGNNQNKLDDTEFTAEFKNTVKYINDISNGFENAIQDRIKSEKLKAELITNVSHDIKTPLTSIINYVDLLKQENIENEKAKEYIGILDNKSQRLKKLTEDLVEASKVSTGNISLNLEKINIIELIRQATGEFEDKFDKKGLKTIISNKENEVNIMADSRYMYRIIENLFSNISKYALENSRVYIDIREKQKEVEIEIKNISKDSLNISAEELMQRFVRGDKSRTTEGSGLGISIAQNLTELQNGKFNLKLDGDLFKVELIFDVI